MRRSLVTNYKTLETVIFEYKDNFFIMERCQQGRGNYEEQTASDFSGLHKKLPISSSAAELGEAILSALENFDSEPTPFDQFDDSTRRKFLKKWFEYRGINEWEINQRTVDVYQILSDDCYRIRPYDNLNHHPWNGPEGMPETMLQGPVDAATLGMAVFKAFEIATYHPDRILP